MDQQMTTVAIDKETHDLMKLYCILEGIELKEFVSQIANEKLTDLKDSLTVLRKLKM